VHAKTWYITGAVKNTVISILGTMIDSIELLPHFFFNLSDGGRLRYSQFTPAGTPIGTVLVLPGRTEFIEKKYIEVGKPLIERGYRVIILELRGQGLSSRMLESDARQRDHADTFNMHLNDLRAFYASVIKPGLDNNLIVHGHSFGAHIAIRWLSEDRPEVTGAFLTSPMLAFSGMAAQIATYGLSWASVRLFSHETNYAAAQHDFNDDDCVFANNPLTQDESRFRVTEKYYKKHSDLAVGGVTWGWMLAALRSMNETHAWPYLARIDVPVLGLVGALDIVTPPSETAPFLNQIPRMRTHIITGAMHDILNDSDAVIAEAWRRIDEFLKSITLQEVHESQRAIA